MTSTADTLSDKQLADNVRAAACPRLFIMDRRPISDVIAIPPFGSGCQRGHHFKLAFGAALKEAQHDA